VLVFQLIFFCITHPFIGIPLVAIVIVVLFVMSKQNDSAAGAAQGRSGVAARANDAAGRLRERDPGFDPADLCRRVSAGFVKLQGAWSAQDLSAVRPFISDGVHERFSLQFAEQKAQGYRNAMQDVAVLEATIADSATDAVYDEVAVRIRARAQDFRVSLADGRRLPGPAVPSSFTEIWSFLRRRGAATVAGKPGLLEGNCPNCGAPVAMNESANCTNCSALLRSGEYDWVLAEITQEPEWRPGQRQAVPGLLRLRQRDPDLNVESLEDRASVVFWRKAAADRLGQVGPIRKVASPSYCEQYVAGLRPPPGARRAWWGQCAVGSVHVLGFLPPGTSRVDRALVEVRWSGTPMVAGPDGAPPRPNGPTAAHRMLFVFIRDAEAKTEVAKGISSAHCPNCGAPESGGTSGACEFCGTALNDGSHGWVLDATLGLADGKAQALLGALREAATVQ
jgi:hypothetical protein